MNCINGFSKKNDGIGIKTISSSNGLLENLNNFETYLVNGVFLLNKLPGASAIKLV